jgi:hypothetical protein
MTKIGVKRVINQATAVTFQFSTQQHILLQRTLNNKRYKTIVFFSCSVLYDRETFVALKGRKCVTNVGFEVLVLVCMNTAVFWAAVPLSSKTA